MPGPSSATGASAIPDPLEPGSFAVERRDYDALATVVQSEISGGPGHAYPERLRGTLHFPETGAGPFPAIVFLHGRHETCRVAEQQELLLWPCPDAPPAVEDLPSWEGFDYVASNLASHGYVVMSINANGINLVGSLDGTPERVQLVHRSLELLAEWNEGARLVPDGVDDALEGRVDLDSIGLVGHSRGGQAVAAFMIEEAERGADRLYPGLRAVLAIQPSVNLSPRAPYGANFGMILGSCDGDVGVAGAGDWDRGRFVDPDDPFARVQFHVTGANHNWFNSEWPDEWTQDFDSICFPHPAREHLRLTRADQERVGVVLAAAFLRRYVGGETALDPLMTGEVTIPETACPTGTGPGNGKPVSCDQLVRTSYLAPAAERRMVLLPAADHTQTEDGGAVVAEGFSQFSVCGEGSGACPEDSSTVLSAARQVTLAWAGPATLRLELGDLGSDVSDFQGLTFRTAVNPSDARNEGLGYQDLEVILVEGDGDRASVVAAQFTRSLVLPRPNGGGDYLRGVLNGAWMPLSAFASVDLTDVSAIELRFGTRTQAGSIQLSELSFQGSHETGA